MILILLSPLLKQEGARGRYPRLFPQIPLSSSNHFPEDPKPYGAPKVLAPWLLLKLAKMLGEQVMLKEWALPLYVEVHPHLRLNPQQVGRAMPLTNTLFLI